MSTSDHTETDGQTERVNRVLEEILRGYVQSFTDWSEFLPMVEFAINNSVHASTTHTPFFVNGLRHPRLPTHLECDTNSRGGGIRSSKNRSVSCSSRVEVIDDANVADVDQIDIEADDLSDSDDLLLTQMRMTMLVYLASPMTTPARMRTPSLKYMMTS